MIPYARQFITDEDVAAVEAVLRSDWLTQGPQIEAFEKKVADYCGVPYAVAVASCSAGLHIACQAMGLKNGERLWTSPNTFVSSANCGQQCGAEVDFVDIDKDTWNLSVQGLEEKLQLAERNGTLPDVVVPVHFAGQSCEMDEIGRLAQKYGFKVIEDAAHAIGGQYKGQPVGSCAFSDAVIFSFHPVKIITSGEGGMVLTRDEALYEKLIRLRTLGISRDESLFQEECDGPWYYEMLDLGQHCRMTDIQAALGLSQMQRIEENISRRNQLHRRYVEAFGSMPLRIQKCPEYIQSSHHLFPVSLQGNVNGKTRRQIFEELRAEGIFVNVHYIPVYRQPYYRGFGYSFSDYPHAEDYYAGALSLPMFHSLSDEQQELTIDTLNRILACAA